MFDYGVLLEHGMGVALDDDAAKQWYAMAAAAGIAGAKDAAAKVGTAPP